MDLQTMVIGAAIFVMSAIVIYIISVCSMREKTFEEVVEEQRRLQAEELKKQKVEKKDKVRRRYPGRGKKKGEKSDDKNAPVGLLESESENDRVAEPEMIAPLVEPAPQQQHSAKSERKNKKDKKKPREEVIVTHDDDLYEPLVKDQVEEVMVAQKVAVETMEAPSSHGHKKSKRGAGAQKAEQLLEEQIIVQEEVEIQEVAPLKAEAPLHHAASDNTKKSKKLLMDGGGDSAEDHTDAASPELVQMVKQAVLTEAEVTLLVEILQGKPGMPAQWTKKSKQADAVSLLKKQLEDKEKAFQDEHQLAQNAAQKLRDLRADLARERQRYETLQKQAAEHMKGQEEEKEALQARMQQTHEQHTAEVTAMRRQVEVSKLAQDQAGLVQRLTEENQKLKETANQAQAAARQTTNDKVTLKMLQEELSKNVVKLSASTNANKNLEAQLNRCKDQLKSMESTQHEAVTDMTEQLHRSDSRNATLVKDLESARSSAGRMEQELTNVHGRIKEFQAQEGHARAMEQQLQDTMHAKNSLETRLGEIERLNKMTDSQLKQLREENNLLAAQLKESKERTSGEGQEAPATEQNGEVNAPAKAELQIAQMLGEKEGEISQLQTELQAKLEETTKLSMDLEAQKAKNNALREKNWKAMDALSLAEKKAEGAVTLKDNLSSKNTELERLKKELQMAERDKHELVAKQEAVVAELSQEAADNMDAQLIITRGIGDENEGLRKQMQDMEETLNKVVEDKLNELKSYNLQLAQKDSQLNEMAALRKQLEIQAGVLDEFTELKSVVATKEKELSKLVESQQGEVEQLREKLTQDMKSKEAQVEQLTDELATLNNQNKELVTSTESSCSQWTTQVEHLNVELASKETEVCLLQKKIDALQELATITESSQSEWTTQIEHLTVELASKTTEACSLQQKVNDLERSLQEHVTSAESSCSQLTTQVEHLNMELASKTTEACSLQQKVDDMEGSLQKLTKEADNAADNAADATRLSTELGDKAQLLQKATKELEDMRAENQELRAGCLQAAAALTLAERSAEETIAQVQTELNSKVTEVARLTHRLEESRAQNSALQQEKRQIQGETPPDSPGTTSLQDVTILTRVQEKSSFDVSRIMADLDARDVELSIMQSVLSEKESENRKFKEQLAQTNSLRREMNDQASEVASLSQQLNLQKQKTHELQDQLAQGHPTALAPPPDVAFLKDELEVKATEITNLRDIVKCYWTENNALKEKVDALEEAAEETPHAPSSVVQEDVACLEQEMRRVRKELEERTVSCSQLQESFLQLRQEAKELQKKNNEITEELQKSQQQAKASSLQQDELQNTKKILHRIFPDIAVSEATKYSEWISIFEKQAPQYIISDTQNGTDHSKELEESQQAQSRLQAQVHQYKQVLADTEGILNKLQSSVEEEENKWRLRVATAEEHTNQLDVEVKSLREKLSTIEGDKLTLQSKISELMQSLNSLKTELMDLTSDSTNKEEEVSKMKQDLEDAFKQKKELTSATVKLNGMLKTGQDALKAEQEQVAKLRAQLAERSKGLANGSSRPQEIEQLKTNLAQTQRQLEREVQVNKQLTQRLDAGVESSGDGSSV